ncbi:SGNH/GDSL hydrolase family protein [Vineibacter terrae]|uniref:SGNH/GDSL hydrolase family protein n=1 Tax=Vineibacter terrae TaxID=2586908 RepID=A0A5C8PR19_9HYPH|nr:SGNH/GDSL hydrolase family protein [Vineibacter terrae]TXL77067.1 SGNH/GDSL hydrolase family protein [Vineibacter terrae]
MKNILSSIVMFVVSVVVALGIGEAALRFKNADMRNYDIEMWRYALELKKRSDDPVLGHDHQRSKSAVLQSVEIRTNELGLRGGPTPPVEPGQRRILFLGSSVTLGWGVPEKDTVEARLQEMFKAQGDNVVVMNAGIGNYNAERYAQRFLTELTATQPTDIVVHYFVRDAEKLDAGGGNWFLRNSQLAVTLWIAGSRLFGESGEKSLVDHYKQVYEPSQPGYQAMLAALKRLKDYAASKNIRVYLAMTPDVHDLVDYKFDFIHERMKAVAGEDGFSYVDLLPAMRNLKPEELWSMPGDPHPNSLGHKLMAEALFPALQLGK